MYEEIEVRLPVKGGERPELPFSLGRLDHLISRARRALGSDATLDEIESHLVAAYPDLPDHTLAKLTILVSGEIPPDDFGEAEIATIEQPDHQTAHVEMAGDFAREAGDLVFFGSVRWVIASRTGRHFVLKRF